MKLFIAINFNTNTRSRLLALRDELRSHSERGNFSRPENLHLTLVFLGECDVLKTATIKHVMSMITFEPFALTIERIGRFKRDSGDIWWAGIQESKTLIDLQGALTDKLISRGFALDKRKYSPHITLGRKVMTDTAAWFVEPFGETVCKIELVKSELVNGKLTYTTIYSTGDIHQNYDTRPTHYNYTDIISITDINGSFIDFALKNRHPIITDYSRINRDIIVNDNVISLGENPKTKSEIKSIDELEKKLRILFLVVHKNYLDNMAYLKGESAPNNEELFNIYNSDFKKMATIMIYQVIFDILYDKYLMDSPWLTLNQYCENYVCYGWDDSISEEVNTTKPVAKQQGNTEQTRDNKKLLPGSGEVTPDNFDKIKAANKWMTEAIKRDIDIKNNPTLKEDSIKLGINPDTYIEFLDERNEPLKKDKTKPKYIWDYIYYNGHPELITSKQFKRSFNKKNKNNKTNNNYSSYKINELFKTYDRFVKAAFTPENDNDKDYYNKSMDYYHLEIYKRIDYIYKLAMRMETVIANNKDILSVNMNRDILSVKRFHPAVFWPIEDNNNNRLRYDDKQKYYKPSLLIEDLWQESLLNSLTELDDEKSFYIWHNLYLFRAKIYELFNYHCKFVSDDYNDITKFLQTHYNILTYHEPNKEWIQEGRKLKREKEIRIKYAMEINDALFWDSEKRNPIKREKHK